MEEKIFDILAEINERMFKMDQKMDDFKNEMNQKMDDFKKEMLDRQFLFEDEYGKKIDAIFEYVQFQQKTNLQRFDRIDDLEKRVSALERRKV